MTAAFAWGLLGGSSLVIGALVALRFQISTRTVGLIMGFGAGVLISALSFDLITDALERSSSQVSVAAGVFAGCAVFYCGDRLIGQIGARTSTDSAGEDGNDSALGIVLGTILDGIPESMVIGLTIYEGGAVGGAFLAAVFISNLPESISSSSELAAAGWTSSRILWMWTGIAMVAGIASLAGFALLQDRSQDTVAFVLAFAAGAILTMLADSMMPQAFRQGGKLVGVATTLGFVVALTMTTFS